MSKFGQRETRLAPQHLRWTYQKLKPGEAHRGWVAGPMVWVAGHWAGSHKPCTKVITHGQLTCKFCLTEAKQREMGYLPVYDDHLRQFVYGIGPDLKVSVERLKVHQPVRIRKGRATNDPIVVELFEWTKQPCFAEGRQRNSQDIEPWLLQLWGDKELVTWFSQTNAVEATEQIPQEVVVPPVALVTPTQEITFTKRKLSEYTKGMGGVTKKSTTPPPPQDAAERNGTH